MEKSKKLLLVCWDFPPNDGIGGRRWAKIAKELVKQGYQMDVICKEKDAKEKVSPWFKDVNSLFIERTFLKQKLLSKYLSHSGNPLKVQLATRLLKLIYNGTIYDKAIGLENEFVTAATHLIKEKNIEVIIATGAPFNLLFYTAKLKNTFKNIKIIADYRDPWITAENYGMKELNNKRRNFEIEKQNFVFENVNVVTCPNKFLLKEIKASYSGKIRQLAEFVEVSHFYDPDDKINYQTHSNKEKVRFVYGGTIYLNSELYLRLLNEAITFYRNCKKTQEVQFDFYTNECGKSSLFNDNSDIVSFHKPIGEKIFEKIADADYIIILLADHNKDYLTSKFFEFMPYHKKYLFIGPTGYVSHLIEQNELGYVLKEKDNLVKAIDQLHQNINRIDSTQYELEVVTQKLMKLIVS